jgi:hypothetical protein
MRSTPWVLEPSTAWLDYRNGRWPTRELAILHDAVHRHFGEKALYAVLGLLLAGVAPS